LRWEILILCERSRSEFLEQLLSVLEPQVNALGLRKFAMVDISVHYDENMTGGVGDKREIVRRKSQGDYMSWIDSDDFVSPSYVSRILPLLDGVDQIGFECEVWEDHKKLKRDFHTLAVPGWTEDANAFHRDISHLQPMRWEVALAAPMEGSFGEDSRWATRLRDLKAVKTEHYIDQVMYYYLWRTNKKDSVDARDPWRLAFLENLQSIGPR
jgi:hypothetical protein